MSARDGSGESVTVVLSGSGGAGVITAGGMLLEAAGRAGFYGLLTRSVGPQIRGGEAAVFVRLSSAPVETLGERCDILVALDWRNIERFAGEIALNEESLVIGDPAAGDVPAVISTARPRFAPLPLQEMSEQIKGGRPNMVALGIIAGLAGLPLEALEAVAEKTLARKGPEAAAASVAAIRAGHGVVADLEGPVPLAPASRRAEGERWIISGNEAAGLGAVRGGVRFAAGYPITPATDLLEWLARALARVGGTLVQAEDELASINMIIGASYGGTPAITATSGPGLALMVEAIGLATAAEVPVVVVDVMRGGPSTGLPTRSEQSDLNIAVYGLHGDAPHVVVAPLSVADCLFTTQWAVHLAEAMQVPTIVLSDQFIGQARAVIDRPADVAFIARREVAEAPDEGYRRYALTASGVSAVAIPGTRGGQYTADGLEHTARGIPSSQIEDHLAQLDKRRTKVERFDYGDHWAETDGDGPLAVLTWGSTAGAVRDALAEARRRGVKVRSLALRLLSPVRPAHMAAALEGVEKVLVVEQSHSGQFLRYLRAHYDLPGEVRGFHRPGPHPIRPSEVYEQIATWR